MTSPSDPSPSRGEIDPRPQEARDRVSPDPDPATTTGLEPGGGVPPGETPPGESSTTGVSDRQPDVAGRGVSWVVYAGIGVLVLVVALFFVGHLAGLPG